METTEEFAGLIGVVDQKGYFLQLREAIRTDFQKGNYPFVFPGACSLFGGAPEVGKLRNKHSEEK